MFAEHRMNDIEWTLSVGQVAARSGVAVSTLHFYESKGLIRSTRTSGNQRRYARDELRRIAVIRTAQRVGISLEQVAQAFASLPPNRAPTQADWSRMARAWREDLNQRIAQLELLRDALDGCIGCGCLSLKRCKLRNPGDALAQRGAGARLLDVSLK
jgi:MerR family transcriptional regulator, redox-sensitive transcriptional activator SoxR